MRHHHDSLERLIDLLDSVVQDQVGASLAQTMQRIRRLSQERRAGLPDAESRLSSEIEQLSAPQLRSVIRWLSLFFDLANLVEDLERVQVLQQRDRRARREGKPRGESIGAAVVQLKQQGFTAGELQGWLNRLHIEPVFTAHPSEAKRRTTRQLLRRIRELLPALEDADATRGERQLLADLTVLWQTDLVRPQRPPVMSEVSRGVFFAATLWHVVPDIYRELRESLAECFPHHRFEVPCFVRFGSWIGGDRDGHPFVTAEVTRKTLSRLKRAALENHLSECREMLGRLVMSQQQVAPDEVLQEQIRTAADKWALLAQRLEAFSEYETCRRFLKLIEYRLEATLQRVGGAAAQEAAYASAAEFRKDLLRLHDNIVGRRGELIAQEIVQPWLDQSDTFGFHFASLDVRQNSSVHRQCVDEMFNSLGLKADLDTPGGWASALARLDDPVSPDLDQFSSDSRECIETFLLLADEIAVWGLRPFGGYVISMTHSPRDVMSVLWLWKAAWSMRHPQQPLPPLPIIPLFETIDDLQRAGDVVEELLQLPDYVAYMNRRQIVMVGYSDSTKDGGYLSACWELHQAQQKLATITDRHHVELTVFHGRGGALGRGGGPAARAIRSLPAAAVGGRLRVTEQGEVLAERYDDPRIAHRHLEQVINATLLVSTQVDEGPRREWEAAMETMSATSLAKYRRLVRHPGFLTYFDLATPIGAIESLPIGSRPARRGQRESLSDLRAIPWTFAWTQSRHLLPAWYGFGTAVRDFVDRHDADWTKLRTMYEQWPMFRALVDNAELALAKADLGIAHNYARIVHKTIAEEVWEQISAEFDCSRGAVLMLTGQHELLAETGWLSRSIQSRNPYVDPLNLAQVHLLRQAQFREADDELSGLLRLSIQGIASGLRTTG
jgi:phosphoenolpyruvate carboxylase